MKTTGLSFIGLIVSTIAVSQNVEVIQDEIRSTAYQGKSYLVVKSFTIQPPSGGSFDVNAATNGAFFIRITDAAKVPLNVPPNPDQN